MSLFARVVAPNVSTLVDGAIRDSATATASCRVVPGADVLGAARIRISQPQRADTAMTELERQVRAVRLQADDRDRECGE
jgi:hypothetical protein